MRKLQSVQILPIGLDLAWDFFSSPKNLNEITPNDMVFKITSDVPEKMYEGLFITYKISPFLGIQLDWCTEITHVKDKSFFVDEQRVGPYKLWHHEHHFKEIDEGVEMIDIVSYEPPFGILGKLADKLFLKKYMTELLSERNRIVKEFAESDKWKELINEKSTVYNNV